MTSMTPLKVKSLIKANYRNVKDKLMPEQQNDESSGDAIWNHSITGNSQRGYKVSVILKQGIATLHSQSGPYMTWEQACDVRASAILKIAADADVNPPHGLSLPIPLSHEG